MFPLLTGEKKKRGREDNNDDASDMIDGAIERRVRGEV
jgi:hypothetical protein